jgi:hypothetical protein
MACANFVSFFEGAFLAEAAFIMMMMVAMIIDSCSRTPN